MSILPNRKQQSTVAGNTKSGPQTALNRSISRKGSIQNSGTIVAMKKRRFDSPNLSEIRSKKQSEVDEEDYDDSDYSEDTPGDGTVDALISGMNQKFRI